MPSQISFFFEHFLLGHSALLEGLEFGLYGVLELDKVLGPGKLLL